MIFFYTYVLHRRILVKSFVFFLRGGVVHACLLQSLWEGKSKRRSFNTFQECFNVSVEMFPSTVVPGLASGGSTVLHCLDHNEWSCALWMVHCGK